MNTRPASDRKRFVRERAVDLLPPLVIYYGLHLAGASDWVALLVAVLAAALRVVWVAARDRTLNPFAAFTLLSFGIGLVLTFISGDPRFLLLKDVITISAVGIAFLITAARGHRPLTLIVHQTWAPSRSVQIARHYHTHPDVRRRHRVSSTVGGLTLLAFALVKAALVFLLPISVMVGLSPLMQLAIAAGLIVWTARYLSRAQPALPGPAVATSQNIHPSPRRDRRTN